MIMDKVMVRVKILVTFLEYEGHEVEVKVFSHDVTSSFLWVFSSEAA